MIRQVLQGLLYLILGALSMFIAGGLITLVVSMGAVIIGIAVVGFVGAFLVFCVKEYLKPYP